MQLKQIGFTTFAALLASLTPFAATASAQTAPSLPPQTGLQAKTEQGLFTQGQALLEAGKPVEALVVFDQVLQLNPKDVNAWLGKGHALSDLKQ